MYLGEMESPAAIVKRAWAQAGLTVPPGELEYFGPRLASGEMDAAAVESVILRQNGTEDQPGPHRAEAIARGARPLGAAAGAGQLGGGAMLVLALAAFWFLRKRR